MPLPISDNHLKFLREIATQAYGSKEGTKGGAGGIGILNGRVVKFNTHHSERMASSKTNALTGATDSLREKMRDIANDIFKPDSDFSPESRENVIRREALADIVKILGKSDFNRKSAAKVLSRINIAQREFQKLETGSARGIRSVWKGAARNAVSSKGRDTSFSTLLLNRAYDSALNSILKYADKPNVNSGRFMRLARFLIDNAEEMGASRMMSFFEGLSRRIYSGNGVHEAETRELLYVFLKSKVKGLDDVTLGILGSNDLLSFAMEIVNSGGDKFDGRGILECAKKTAEEIKRQNYTSAEVQALMKSTSGGVKPTDLLPRVPQVYRTDSTDKIQFESDNAKSQCEAVGAMTKLISVLLHTEDSWNRDSIAPEDRIRGILTANSKLIEQIKANNIAVSMLTAGLSGFLSMALASGELTQKEVSDKISMPLASLCSVIFIVVNDSIDRADIGKLTKALDQFADGLMDIAQQKLSAQLEPVMKGLGLSGNLGKIPEGVDPKNIDLLDLARHNNPPKPNETFLEKKERESKILSDYSKLTMDPQAGGLGSLINGIAGGYLKGLSLQEKRAMLSGAIGSITPDLFAKFSNGNELGIKKDKIKINVPIFGEKEIETGSTNKSVLEILGAGVANADVVKEISGEVIGGLLKGSGPVLQKMIQMLGTEKMPSFVRKALDDCKNNLKPLPEEYVKAKLDDLVRRSNGELKGIRKLGVLGSASIGVAYNCEVTDKDGNKRECVIKMLRPDVVGRMNREIDTLENIAKEIGPGALRTMQARISSLRGELNFDVERQNVFECEGIYDRESGAPFRNLASVKLAKGVPQLPDVIAMEKAPGDTFKGYMAKITAKVDNLCSQYLKKDPDTGRYKPVTVTAEKRDEVRQEVTALYNDVYAKQYRLQRFIQTWLTNALFGNGKFHGDLHAGNIMIDDATGMLTVIDFGNAPQFKDSERKNVVSLLVAASCGKTTKFLDTFAKLVPAESRATIAQERPVLTGILRRAFSSGGLKDAGSRIMAAFGEMNRRGVEIPASLYNFAEAFVRVSQLSDSMISTLAQINGIIPNLRVESQDPHFVVDGEEYNMNLRSVSPGKDVDIIFDVAKEQMQNEKSYMSDGEAFMKIASNVANDEYDDSIDSYVLDLRYDLLNHFLRPGTFRLCYDKKHLLDKATSEFIYDRHDGRMPGVYNDARNTIKQMIRIQLSDHIAYNPDLEAAITKLENVFDSLYTDRMLESLMFDLDKEEYVDLMSFFFASGNAEEDDEPPLEKNDRRIYGHNGLYELQQTIVNDLLPEVKKAMKARMRETADNLTLRVPPPVTTADSLKSAVLRNPFSAISTVGLGNGFTVLMNVGEAKTPDIRVGFEFRSKAFSDKLDGENPGNFMVNADRELVFEAPGPVDSSVANAEARRGFLEMLAADTAGGRKRFFESEEYGMIASVLGIAKGVSMSQVEKAPPLTSAMVEQALAIHAVAKCRCRNKAVMEAVATFFTGGNGHSPYDITSENVSEALNANGIAAPGGFSAAKDFGAIIAKVLDFGAIDNPQGEIGAETVKGWFRKAVNGELPRAGKADEENDRAMSKEDAAAAIAGLRAKYGDVSSPLVPDLNSLLDNMPNVLVKYVTDSDLLKRIAAGEDIEKELSVSLREDGATGLKAGDLDTPVVLRGLLSAAALTDPKGKAVLEKIAAAFGGKTIGEIAKDLLAVLNNETYELKVLA